MYAIRSYYGRDEAVTVAAFLFGRNELEDRRVAGAYLDSRTEMERFIAEAYNFV